MSRHFDNPDYDNSYSDIQNTFKSNFNVETMGMNKLEQKFHDKLLSHLSDHNTKSNIDNAVEVCRTFSLSFSLFCARNYKHLGGGIWESLDNPRKYVTTELFNIFIEND